MECVVIGIIGLVALSLLAMCAGSLASSAPAAEGPAGFGGLNLLTVRAFADLESGERLEILDTTVHGNLVVPYDGIECQLVYRILDVTDPDEILPVVCDIDDLTSGESPLFDFRTPLRVPYRASEIAGLEMPRVPLAALHMGRRGQRHLLLSVHISNPTDDEVYAYGEAQATATQADQGFLEQGERTAKTDRAIAALGLAVCASDGHIDRRETEAIKRYFNEQFAGLAESETGERRDQLNEAMRELLTNAKEVVAKMSPAEIVAELRARAATIASLGSVPLNRAAYQLVLQIVAADEQVEDSELAAVKIAAQVLGIHESVDREMRDHHFKLAMFASGGRSSALNMPAELSREEQKAFLNREYERWRPRVTHSDPKVREEATARLKTVTRMRRELEDG